MNSRKEYANLQNFFGNTYFFLRKMYVPCGLCTTGCGTPATHDQSPQVTFAPINVLIQKWDCICIFGVPSTIRYV